MAPAAFFSSSFNTVCVMDANSRLGCGLVEQLLRQGYEVHAAIQSPKESQALRKLACDHQNLQIFHSDPFDYQSIVDALKGCSGLFYNFEPPEDYTTYDEFMGEIEVRAAHNVVEACAQTDTIDKVVFTSSATAVIWREDRKSSKSDSDETYWTDINFCRKFKLWHALSKTVAEKAAWALAMDRGVSMVCINAGLLTGGPDLTITNPYLKGAAEMYEDGVFVTVDLDFLVEAHVSVFENIASFGRYLCFNHVIKTNDDAVKLAQMLTPDSPQPPPSSEKDMRIIQQRISNKKLNSLMEDFRSGPC
ncbi:cinnamoyl-CoA reductase-like SNL6 [Diospyros lotus]|uniref:cinnamoyl-CoA reductase-like SNL6 n=1 Tax=Diospyros lotus TaxID=55363 RepID=UPI00225B1EF2|nr:cinnamoyl-CoA reductase-like SNL6 [Diospyros lotus]